MPRGRLATPDGEQRLRYQNGTSFIETTAQRQAALAVIAESLAPGGGLGEDHLRV